MKRIEFLGTCPGCGDTHVEIKGKKPTLLVPNIVKAVCDKCESTILYQITIPRDRENKSQVGVRPIRITPSNKLVEILKLHEALSSVAEAPPATSPS